MTSPAVELTHTQEARLHSLDHEVEDAMHEVEAWLRKARPDRPVVAGMSAEERARYDRAKQRLRQLSDEREALRAKLYAQRSDELRREHLAATVADQELSRAEARAGSGRGGSSGFGQALKRIFGRS